jgi:hypothetical protein
MHTSAMFTPGGDTTLKGAVVTGNQVNTNVGGNLTIASLQDSNTCKGSSQQVGGSVMVGISSAGPVSGKPQSQSQSQSQSIMFDWLKKNPSK